MAEVIRAGADQPTRGEESALAVLRGLPKSWTVIANKILTLDHADSYELDFVIVGDHRIILIDEKSYGGKITGTDEVWSLGSGQTIPSPFNKMDMNAKRMASWLGTRITGMPNRNASTNTIVGGVMLSDRDVSAQIADLRASRCLFIPENATEKLKWLDKEGATANFDFESVRDKVVKTLYNDNSARTLKRPSTIALYSIEDEIDRRERCRVYLGKHEEGYRRTLYVYENLIGGQDSLQQALDHELYALRTLQKSAVVPTIGETFLWSEDRFRVVPVHLPKGFSIGTLALPSSEKEAIREIEIAAAAFAALTRIHSAGVTHRALRPDAVFVDDPVPPGANELTASAPAVMFAGFVAARVENTATISSQLDEAGFGDPYAAPEITKLQSYGFADQSSDVYSLALVTLERITRLRVSELIEALGQDQSIPEQIGLWPFLPEATIDQLQSAYNAALTLGAYDNRPRAAAQDMANALTGIARDLRRGQVWEKGPVPGTDYEIKALLGTGANARTYLVVDTRTESHFAGKQYYRSGSALNESEIIREFKVLWEHNQENLPRTYSPPDPNDPLFQIKLEWIDGESLRARSPVFRHDRQTWTNLKNDLLNAVSHLETHAILHRDIKPENVMIRASDGKAFLIDYGSSSSSQEPGTLAGSPRYWPPEWRSGDGYPPSGDRYAVAVTLFEALTGELPFSTENAAFSSEPLSVPPGDLPEDLRKAAKVLLQAVSIDPTERFETISALRVAIDQALVDGTGESLINAEEISETDREGIKNWIDNLRGLFRNSSRGNADNRGLDTDFARNTYVPTALDTRLWPAVHQHKPAAVFLSGNPGDGKTAFLEQVRLQLEMEGAAIQDGSDQSGWEATIGDRSYRACFDASESANGMSANEQVAHRLRGLEGTSPDPGITILLAINDGRLAEVRDQFEPGFPWLTKELMRTTNPQHVLNPVTDAVWTIDLKQRAYVSLKSDPAAPSPMREMLSKIVDPPRWPNAQAISRISHAAANAIALQASGPDAPATRMEFLLVLAHLRGLRHTTIRDLRSALALTITADMDIEGVSDSGSHAGPFPWSGKYWNTLFTTDSSEDLVLGELRWLDPGRFAHPALERFLYFRHRPEDAATRARLFQNGIDEPPPDGDSPDDLKEWIKAFKRRLVLEGVRSTNDSPIQIDPLDLLPYGSAKEIVQILSGEMEPNTLLPRVLKGISRSDGIQYSAGQDGLVLRVRKSEEYGIEMVKVFPESEFDLQVSKGQRSTLIETTPRMLVLSHGRSSSTVHLNLDLIDILLRLAAGLEPATVELQPLLEELLTFKSRIQRSVSDRLLILDGTRKHWLVKEGDKLVRTDA